MCMIPVKLQQISDEILSTIWAKELILLGKVYIVGGCVRDAFLGLPIKDIDLVVDGTDVQNISRTLQKFGRVDIVGESFSVVKFSPEGHTGEPFDIAVPRVDVKVGTGHKGFKVLTDGVGIAEDLKRRDFTINSMAFDIQDGVILDPFKGLSDIKRRVLRATDLGAFIEDPLRILRGIQFASRFGLKVNRNTLHLMTKHSHLVKETSGERILGELQKIIHKGGDTRVAMNLMTITRTDIAILLHRIPYTSWHDQQISDETTFFYLLVMTSDPEPDVFLKHRLKCEYSLQKNVKALHTVMSLDIEKMPREQALLLIYKQFVKCPDIKFSPILPSLAAELSDMMVSGKVPLTPQQLEISGDDIISLTKVSGPTVGKIMDILVMDALTGLYDWKDRYSCITQMWKIYEGVSTIQ